MSEIILSMDRVNVVVAYTSKDRYIGLDGDLPWKRALKGDMRYVTHLIRLHPNIALVVGRKTYETIKRIKDVTMFVVTSSECEGVTTFRSVKDAVETARSKGMYVIAFGGSGVYEEVLKQYDCKLFCTVVEQSDLKGDRKFPQVEASKKNVSKEVDQFLVDSKVERTWELRGDCFFENGYEYRFYIGQVDLSSQ